MARYDSDYVFRSTLPKSRDTDIVVQEIGDEILLYDLKTNKAHHLNQTVSLVWKHSDGKTSLEEMSKVLSEKLNVKVEDDFVLVAIDELNKIDLLEEKIGENVFDQISRREVFFKYALPAIALPIVVSLVTPASAQAQASCLGTGQIDCFNIPCCPGLVCRPLAGGGVLAGGECAPII